MTPSPSSRVPPADPNRLFKYPPMERQDLNQSQLGSFKFTPVDSVQSIQDAAARSLAHSFATCISPNPHPSSHRPQSSLNQSTPASPSTDPSFFNNHIKPDLAESRLRLGPAAFRSAVEHASVSPIRKDRYALGQNFGNHFKAGQQNYLPPTLIDIGRDLQHKANSLIALSRSPVMDSNSFSTMSRMDDKGIESSRDSDDGSTLTRSLCIALANEQEAHQATKTAALQLGKKVVQLESDIEKLQNDMKSRDWTIKMLKGIIKNKEEESVNRDAKIKRNARSSSSNDDDADLREFYRNHQQLAKQERTSILYDALERQKCEYEKRGYPAKEQLVLRPRNDHQKEASTNDVQLFDFEALQSPEVQKTLSKDWQQTLRKHFSVENIENIENIVKTPGNPSIRPDKLMELSPDTTPNSDSTSKERQVAPQMQSNFPNITNGGQQSDESSSEKSSQVIEYKMPSQFPGHPKWKISKQNPIFDDVEEVSSARAMGGPPMNRSSQFYTHPVRYLPEDAVTSTDCYRTVMVYDIPVGTNVKEVLNIVKGGYLESIELVGPIGNATNFMTARLVFIHESGAMGMISHQGVKGLEINGTAVHAWLVQEPTYPRPSDMDDEIFGEEQASRILLVGGVDKSHYELVRSRLELLNLSQWVVECAPSWGHYVAVEFTSVKYAIKARHAFRNDFVFHEADLTYDDDYCCEA